MKNFLVGWIIWQLFIIGITAGFMDANKGNLAEINRKVDCQRGWFKVGVVLIDVTVPLIQFTSEISTRDCSVIN